MWLQREITLRAAPARLPPRHARGGRARCPSSASCGSGLLHLFIRHTSASLTLNENASPDVRDDFESYFNEAVPEDAPYWTHTIEGPDDMPAHIKASLLGPSLSLPVADGRLALGTWQGIYLCEHRDRGGARSLLATLHGEAEDGLAAAPDRRRASRRTRSRPRGRPRSRRPGRRSRPGAPTPPPRSSRRRAARIRLDAASASGPLAAIAAASSRAAATASPGSASRLTIPIACARSARDRVAGERQLHRQVVGDPLAAAGAARRAAATSQRLTSGMPSFASRAATIRSQASATSKPPATAKPSIAAMIGLSRRALGDAGEAAALDVRALAGHERLQVHAGAERAARAGEDRRPAARRRRRAGPAPRRRPRRPRR